MQAPPVLIPLQRASGGQAVEEEVWEHQRFFPVRGWTSTLPTERKRFARSEDGSGSQHKFPQVDPPDGERQRFLFGGSVHAVTCLSASRQCSQMERVAKEKVSPKDFLASREQGLQFSDRGTIQSPKKPNARLTQITKHHVRLQQAAASA